LIDWLVSTIGIIFISYFTITVTCLDLSSSLI